MYRMYSNRTLSFSYFRAILFGGRRSSIISILLFLGGLLLELKPPGLLLDKGILLEHVRYLKKKFDEILEREHMITPNKKLTFNFRLLNPKSIQCF